MGVPINLDWPQFKGFVTQFSFLIDYAPEGTHYFLFSSNGSVMLSCYLTDPTEVLEFETFFKPDAFEVSIPPNGGGPGTLVVQGTTPWVCSIIGIPALPAGAATAARQDTGNASLASIDGKIPAQGQALMAASTPVVIASNQSAVPASQSGAWFIAQSGLWSVSISGTVAATQSGVWSVAQSGAWAVSAVQSGVWTVAISGTVPISAASLPLPAGAATETTLAAINTKTLIAGQAVMSASSPVTIASDQSSLLTNIVTNFTHIAAAGTTVLKSGAGILHRIAINDTGGGSYTFYNNTSAAGAVIAVVRPGAIGTITFGLRFTLGLTVLVAGVAGDTTVTFD